ncbi:alpha-amylase family glycosyl hydrolase [Fodinibius halophilus]|uniref:T9SS type A sorting domain-containing protein n=1 Tax=Fodinibius halophilus TaxID=1736908 RepID=A0A6M1SZF3_9BACT|nr:alpha-amylase family glycosyl hydrolase [Fodinibius halophilus]NGP87037.1 T9SS type A sorting domain-containing protein [Fodinibius halophilus]
MKRLLSTLLFFLFSLSTLQGQVVTTNPEFPTADQAVTVYFDATKGNGGLESHTGDVYAHTGLITDESTDGSDWKYDPSWGDNSAKYKLERVETNLYKLEITPSIREYYGAGESEVIKKMAFVFRNSDGSKEGKETGGEDIYAEVYENSFNVTFLQPSDAPTFIANDSSLTIKGIASSEQTTELSLSIDGQELKSVSNDTLEYTYNAQTADSYTLTIAGTDGSLNDTLSQQLIVNPQINEQPRPAGFKDGITYVDDNTVRLSLFAPHKEFVYVIGEFNNWQPQPTYFMNRETVNDDSTYYWIELNGLTAGQEYAFQYFVDGEVRVADPYSEKVLQPEDQHISEETYPNLKAYPDDQTDFTVGVLQPGKTEYQWQHNSYDRPDKDELVVYELLVRDFVENHDYQTLTDTLDYLDRLGVNAIELMPVMEFEGNISWGYNSAFLFATDKYYGPADDLKAFIDEAHSRGMAVILDIVLNHVYGQSPLVRLWNEGEYGQPTTENPYLNVVSPNQTYSWGYDFNHESQATKYYVDRVTSYWLEEFNADGYRFDFTKGFTQNSGDGWAHDADRIRILQRMADRQWAVDDSSYVILEHLTANSEEQELSDYGMLLWGNMNHNYKQAAMGYENESDFSGIYHKNRNWNNAHLMGYMESHDEQRLMYENLNFGNKNSSGSYDITELNTALNRIKLSAAFFFTVPGPKMFWQFGELGYEIDINQNGRTGEKPIRWEYYDNKERKKLYNTYKALIRLRNSHEAFTSETSNVTMDVNNTTKRITISHPDLEVTIAGNFGVTDTELQPQFTQTGDWYDFFSGDTLSVNNTDTTITMSAGEFHIYTTQKFKAPTEDLLSFVPTQINLDISQSFSSASSPQNYRMIALPGQVDEELTDVLNGDPEVAWQAYWDNGNSQDYLVKYDGSSTFLMKPGNGFWVTSKQKFAYDQTVATVSLDENNQAAIPLHKGWNIISNPLDIDIAWSTVTAANGGSLPPIWRFDGAFSEASDFTSARSGEAFYFLNDQGLDKLLIPYNDAPGNNKQITSSDKLQLTTYVDGNETSSSSLVFVRSDMNPPSDVIAPPSGFEGASLRFAGKEEEQKSSRTGNFARIYRTPKQQGHQLEIILSTTPGKAVNISAKGLDENAIGKIALLNTQTGHKYDLTNGKSIKLIPKHEQTPLLLVMGDTSFIDEQQDELLPKQVEITPNYPNPFNPSTTLQFKLPQKMQVRVQVYNILGRRISTLINNEVHEAGVHTITFDASQQSSGMYFAVFEIGDRRFVQKMMLIK